MSILSLVNLHGIIVCVAVGGIVLFLNPRKHLNRVFMFMSFSFAFWGLVNLGFGMSRDVKQALFWVNLFALWHFSVSLLLHFILAFTEKNRLLKKPAVYAAIYAPAFLFVALDLWKSYTLGIPVKTPSGWAVYNPRNIVFYADILWACCASVLAAVMLVRYYFSVSEKLKKKQALYVGSGFLIPIFSSVISIGMSMFSGVWNPEYATCSFALTSLIIGYGIWKHRLFSLTPSYAAENIISTMTDGLLIVDDAGVILTANNAVRAMLGYSNQQLVGTQADALFSDPAASRPLSDKTWFHTVQSCGNISDIPTSLATKNSGRIPVSMSVSILTDNDGEMNGMVFICRDMTERLAAQEALKAAHDELENKVRQRTARLLKAEDELFRARKLESMGVLAAGIARDFSAVLSEMVTRLFTAKMYLNARDDAYRHITEAEAAAFRASRITEQLLAFSKDGAPVKERTSIKRLVEDAVGFCLSGSSATYRLELPDDLLPVDIDRGQIDRVISSLVINADQATQGGGAIVVAAENMVVGDEVGAAKSHYVNASSLEAGTYVRISITDDGEGISKEHLDKIFDPYFTTKKNCNGLGLTSAYSIVRKHGGYITVDSTPGKGSTFCVYLPSASETSGDADAGNACETVLQTEN